MRKDRTSAARTGSSSRLSALTSRGLETDSSNVICCAPHSRRLTTPALAALRAKGSLTHRRESELRTPGSLVPAPREWRTQLSLFRSVCGVRGTWPVRSGLLNNWHLANLTTAVPHLVPE